MGILSAMAWRLDDLRTFLDVLETGSMTATAARLDLAKSVVSKRIADLETALGTSLFQRSAGRIRPTETALSFGARVQPLVTGLDEAAANAAWGERGLRGRLRVTAPMSFGILHLGPIIAGFAVRHPDLAIEIHYDDRTVDLIASGFDVGVRIGVPQDSSLVARRLCEDPRAVCAAPSYLAERGTPRHLADLDQHDGIDYAHLPASQIWQFLDPQNPSGDAVSTAPRSRILANNGEAMRDLAIAGLGLALLPRFIVSNALRDGRLVPVLPGLVPRPLTIHVVYPPARPLAPKIRAFVDHLVEGIGPRPHWLD